MIVIWNYSIHDRKDSENYIWTTSWVDRRKIFSPTKELRQYEEDPLNLYSDIVECFCIVYFSS